MTGVTKRNKNYLAKFHVINLEADQMENSVTALKSRLENKYLFVSGEKCKKDKIFEF